ncbi:MAG: molybdenum cofactor guanylyltransferase [Mycobacterium sp.]|nr:molybdenum cofactor guanylyltransferase [Mycobacterium sp.]
MPQGGPSSTPLAAVILAGGGSRRMGRDKATMPHPGPHSGPSELTMVENTVAVLVQRCSPIFVIAAPGQVLPALDAEILRDEVSGGGPLPATGWGLRAAAAAGSDRAVVCAVDMPYLSVELIDRLAVHRSADVVLPWDGRDHYLAGIYRTSLADDVNLLVKAGESSMRALTGVVAIHRVVLSDERALINLNYPNGLR